MRKRLSCGLLVLLVITPLCFSSCTEKEEAVSTSEPTTTTVMIPVEENKPVELPDVTYGCDFRILMRNDSTHYSDFFVEENSNSQVDQAVYERNDAVCSKYDIELKLLTSSSPEGDSERRVLLAGEDYYDLIAPHGRSASKYAVEKICQNLYDLPYLNLSFPWWNQLANEAFTINGVLYFTTGDISHTSSACTYTLLFNKTELNNFGIDYPYDAVRNNTWTWEAFKGIVKECGRDLNGDQQMDLKVDCFSYLTHYWAGPWQAFFSSNNRILTTDENGTISLTGGTESAYNAMVDFYKLMNESNCFLGNQSEYWSMIGNGLFTFADCTLLDITLMTDTGFEYGIVPFPKIDLTMEHYACNVAGAGNMFLVPITIKDWDNGGSERTSAIIEALCQGGYNTVRPVFFEKIVSYRAMKTQDNYEMLPYIVDGRLFDMGYYHMALGGMSTFIFSLGNSAVEFYSTYDRLKDSAEENLIRLINAYKKKR